jgi:hypothetical protein
MKKRSLQEVMQVAENAIARGITPDQPGSGLTSEEQRMWVREQQLRWRLEKPLESIHGPRGRRGKGWRSKLARGL